MRSLQTTVVIPKMEPSASSGVAFNVTNGNVTDFSIGSTVASQQTLAAGQSVTIPVTCQARRASRRYRYVRARDCRRVPVTSSPVTVSGGATVPENVTLATTGGNSGSVTPMAGAIRRAALPIAGGVFTLFGFLWRRNRKAAMGAAILSVAVLAACGGGGGGSTLPGRQRQWFRQRRSRLPTPTPAAGGTGGTPGRVKARRICNGTGDIVAGTAPSAPFRLTLPPGAVMPTAIAPGTSLPERSRPERRRDRPATRNKARTRSVSSRPDRTASRIRCRSTSWCRREAQSCALTVATSSRRSFAASRRAPRKPTAQRRRIRTVTQFVPAAVDQ